MCVPQIYMCVRTYLDDGRLLRHRVEGVVEDGLADNVEGDRAEERLHVHRLLGLRHVLQLLHQHVAALPEEPVCFRPSRTGRQGGRSVSAGSQSPAS